MANIYCEQADRPAPLPNAVLHAPAHKQPAQARAERLYPASPYLQSEWLRAVDVVRQSARGWLLDQPAQRRGASK